MAAPFRKETLFILGGRSRHVGLGDEPLIRRLFPETGFCIIGGAGHWVHADAPGIFFRLVQAFLSSRRDLPVVLSL